MFESLCSLLVCCERTSAYVCTEEAMLFDVAVHAVVAVVIVARKSQTFDTTIQQEAVLSPQST